MILFYTYQVQVILANWTKRVAKDILWHFILILSMFSFLFQLFFHLLTSLL